MIVLSFAVMRAVNFSALFAENTAAIRRNKQRIRRNLCGE